MRNLLLDLRYAVRMLRKDAATALIAVFTLALGIGVSTANFSWGDALLWKPLPLEGFDQLVALAEQKPPERVGWQPSAAANYRDWKGQSRSFESMAAYQWEPANLSSAGAEPERAGGAAVEADFFKLLRARPALGRLFTFEEEQPGRDQVVILGHGLWQRRFGGERSALGRELTVNGRRRTVVGVMRPEFEFPIPAEFWVPLALSPAQQNSRSERQLLLLGRLNAGVDRRRAEVELETVAARLARQYPDSNRGWGARVMPLREILIPPAGVDYSYMLVGAVGFLLAVVCVNVANLQYARVATRMHEAALRRALGARRWRVVRLFLIDSLLVSALGGALGLLFAVWGLDVIRGGFPPELTRFMPGWKGMSIDTRALLFTAGAAIACAVLAGLAPAVAGSRVELNDWLRQAGRGLRPASQQRVRGVLIVAEVALTVVLLFGAALMTKNYRALGEEAERIAPDGLLSIQLALSDSRYEAEHRRREFVDRAVTRLGKLGGVESAVAARFLPYSWLAITCWFEPEHQAETRPGELRACLNNAVTPGYFRALRISLLAGRELGPQDGPDSEPVAVVSRQLARRAWPGQDPIGRRVQLNGRGPWRRVVGVAEDIRQYFFEREPQSLVYLPYAQAPSAEVQFAVRASGPLSPALIKAAAGEVRRLDAEQPIEDIRTMRQFIDTYELSGVRYSAVLLAALGAFALVLALVGVYGVLSYSVRQQTHEIGVIMALGAQPAEVLRRVLRRGLGLAVAGLVLGIALAAALGRIAGSVFLVERRDSLTLAAISMLLLAVAALACYLPARKAAAVDPIQALRYE